MKECCCLTNPNGGFCLPCLMSEHDNCDGDQKPITVVTRPGREGPYEKRNKK